MNYLEEKLVNYLFSYKNNHIVVGFSGGNDSSFLGVILNKYKFNATLTFVKTELIGSRSVIRAKKNAKLIGLPFIILNLTLLNFKEIKFNTIKRCYICKREIYSAIKNSFKNSIIVDGTNYTDTFSFRPGIKALNELEILTPLKDCKITKKDILKYLKLNFPYLISNPDNCIATKYPYNTNIEEIIYARKNL